MKLTMQNRPNGATHVTLDLQPKDPDYSLIGSVLLPHQPGRTVEELQLQAVRELRNILQTLETELCRSK